MVQQPKKYLIAPDFDCPPDTAIRLGHILPSPTNPYETLNADDLLPVLSSISITSIKTGFTATRSQLLTGNFGIWAQILNGAYGGILRHTLSNSQDAEFAIDEIETTFLRPAGKETKDYIRASVDVEDVQSYFEGSRFQKSVYMITGLKIAKGAKVKYGVEKSQETTAKLMVDGTSACLPVQAGPQLEMKNEKLEGMEWKDEKSFVFAYQVRQVKCKKGKVVEDKEYNKGAFLDAESSLSTARSEAKLSYLIDEEDACMDSVSGEEIKSAIVEEEVFLWPRERDIESLE